jgi:pilus assembly protein Flp/PilA
MSDLITTTQDTFRGQCIDLYIGLHSFADTLAQRARENRGQTAAEYMGVLLVVAAIITAVATSAIGDEIRTQAVNLVKKIAGGGGGEA